jgi:hypothetical protein
VPMRTILDRPQQPLHLLWAACGAVVVGYVFLSALGAFEPDEVIELTIAVVALAALLLTHEWREQFRDER